MNKILVTDGMDKEQAQILRNLAYEVIEEELDNDQLKDRVKDVSALIVRSRTKVTKDIVDEAKKTGNLKLVIRGGVGVDNIDTVYCKECGIQVRNTPNASSNSVAELALAQMINISRFVQTANITMRQGKWEKKNYRGCEIMGKTLGLVGCGRIATLLGQKAKLLGMNVIFYDIACFETDEFKRVSLEELLKEADYISVHIPGGKNNEYFISEREFKMMKDGVYFLDLARGGVVDEDALVRAIDTGKVAGAALDVYEEEPTNNKAILNNPYISLTPHIGAATREAQKRIGEEIVNIVKENL